MVAVFAIFATMPFVDNKQLGVGLAAAILLDATIVRGIALPAPSRCSATAAGASARPRPRGLGSCARDVPDCPRAPLTRCPTTAAPAPSRSHAARLGGRCGARSSRSSGRPPAAATFWPGWVWVGLAAAVGRARRACAGRCAIEPPGVRAVAIVGSLSRRS